MNQSDASHIQELIETHQRRLRRLEIQAAQFGDRCDPQILNEIDTIKAHIDIQDRALRDNVSGLYIHQKDALLRIARDINTVEQQISELKIEEKKVYKLFGIIPIWSVTHTLIQIVKVLLVPIGPGLLLLFLGITIYSASIPPSEPIVPTMTSTPVGTPTYEVPSATRLLPTSTVGTPIAIIPQEDSTFPMETKQLPTPGLPSDLPNAAGDVLPSDLLTPTSDFVDSVKDRQDHKDSFIFIMAGIIYIVVGSVFLWHKQKRANNPM